MVHQVDLHGTSNVCFRLDTQSYEREALELGVLRAANPIYV